MCTANYTTRIVDSRCAHTDIAIILTTDNGPIGLHAGANNPSNVARSTCEPTFNAIIASNRCIVCTVFYYAGTIF